MFSFISDNFKSLFEKKHYNSHHYFSEIIVIEFCIDNRIYYSHNLKLLDCYRGKHINIVKVELYNKYKNIIFLFVHKTNKNLDININTIYVIFDDFNTVIDFKGIGNTINDYFNILKKN
jgi:hypothetical protein